MIESIAANNHESCNQLLPWYVNKTLDPDEHRAVESHLQYCTVCQRDLSLFTDMQSAVVHEESSPISVPQDSTTVIGMGANRRSFRLPPMAWQAAAMLLVALSLAWALLVPEPNQQFETVTSEGQASTVQYVLELRFEDAVSSAEADLMMRELGTPITDASVDTPSRVLIKLPPKSLAELEAHARDIASRPEIESAEFVALQLPVK